MKYYSNLEDEENLAIRGKNKNKNLPSLKVILRTHTEVLSSYLIKGCFQTIHNRNKTTIIIKRQVMHVVEYVISADSRQLLGLAGDSLFLFHVANRPYQNRWAKWAPKRNSTSKS